MDGVWRLDPDAPAIRSPHIYLERSFSHGVEDGNDFTDRVVTRRDRSLFVIGIGNHIGCVHVTENQLIGSKQDSDGNDGWVPILVWVDPGEGAIKW